MKTWKIERFSTFDDKELADKLNEIESRPGCKVREVVYIGDNSANVRIYQIIFTEEK